MEDKLKTLFALLKDDPGNPFVLYAIALAYVRLDDTQNARKYFGQLRTQHPEYVALYYHWGKLEEGDGNHREALNLYTEGIRVATEIQDLHALSELEGARDLVEEIAESGD